MWVPSSHSLTPFLLQAPIASEQIVVSAISEWQQMLEAAKALMVLRYSSRALSGSISPLQLRIAPGSLVLERRTQGRDSWEMGGSRGKRGLTGKSALVG